MPKPFIILIDDDKPLINSLILQIKSLIHNNYTIEATQTIPEARNLIRQLIENQQPIHLIIADWLLSGTERINDLLVEIHSQLPEVPIIILSGFADTTVINDLSQRAGINYFIQKPYEETDLVEKINKLLK